MLWNWNTIDACFLSSSWHINSEGAFAATCIGVVLLAILLESLRRIGKEFDNYIVREFQARLAALSAAATDATPQTVTFRASPLQQITRAVIHAITFAVAYILMLLAMYYNGYIIICIFIGAGIGKFLCDWMTATVIVGGPSGAKSCNLNRNTAGIEEPTVCCG